MPLLLAAIAVRAQPYQFSHRTHLTMKLACVRCHPHIPESMALAATQAQIISEDACGDCHGKAILNLAPAPVPILAHFSHKLHLSMKPTSACGACHRGLLESDSITRDLLPRMTECLVCHTEVNPPESCLRCHAAGAQLKPASHTPEFLAAHAGQAGKDPQCRTCHPADPPR